MLKLILSSIGVTFPVHIPYVPDIPYLTTFSTISSSIETHPANYDQLHSPLLIQKHKEQKCSIPQILYGTY